MSRSLSLIGVALVGLLLRATTTAAQTSPVDAQRLDIAIDAAVSYITRTQGDDGRFHYLDHIDPDAPLESEYNLLRHCGTVYALGMAHRRDADPEIATAIRNAQQYIVEHCLRPVPGCDDLLAVWSDPTITGVPVVVAKTGGAGLGLLALLANNAENSAASRDQLRQLGRFILFMQEPDGSIVSRYRPTEGGKDRAWHSLYYPGEAALGLLELYEADPDPDWLNGAAAILNALASSRQASRALPADHWALLATARLLPQLDGCDPPVDRAKLIDHAMRIGECMIQSKMQSRKFTPVSGCFTADGTVTPTATRLEGLLAAVHCLDDGDGERRELFAWHIQDSIEFLLGAQITGGPHTGAFPRAIGPLPDEHPASSPTFNRDAGQIRIDTVQHALSALIQYESRVASPGTPDENAAGGRSTDDRQPSRPNAASERQ